MANNTNTETTSATYKQLLKDVTDSRFVERSDNSWEGFDAGRFIDQDEIMKRFHMGNEFWGFSNNDVFTHGFEDPTRLMFKVEFGEWGASVLSEENIRIQQSTSKFSNVYYEDYDQFPMGLLDLNFNDFDKAVNWNSLTSYNTYNYLMNVNEDARASYIKQFVKGLYVLLRDMPYIFKKISGIEKLLEFQPDKGHRLKDAKITLECYEGIDLKIKTLLQLYRKAAYDDVWQRWVLPDIYRYFKMIIYVFDRRILQTGKGTYSVDQDNFPIYALECGPCEFDIEALFDNEFSANYAEHKDAESKITITVKNVKTYYSNKLFNKIDRVISETQNSKEMGNELSNPVNWISDFDSVTERGSYTSTNSENLGNFRMRWMRRMFMTPSEYRAYYNNMTHKVGDEKDYNVYYQQPIIPEDGWHYATVTNNNVYNINSWTDVKNMLLQNLTNSRILVRDSRYTENRTYFSNDLTRPEYYTYFYDYNPWMVGIDSDGAQAAMRHHIEMMILHMLNSIYLIGNEAYYEIVDPGLVDTSIPDLVMTPLDLTANIPDMEYVKPILDSCIAPMEYVSPIMNLDIPDMEYVEPIMNLDIPDMEYVEPIMNLDLPDMKYIEPIMNLEKPDMNMIEPIMNLDKPDMNMIKPIMDTSIPDMTYVYPIMDTSVPDMTMVEPIFDLSIPDMTMVEPIFDLSVPDMTMVKPIMDLHDPSMEFVEPIMNLEKPDMTMVEPIMDLTKPTLTMVEPIMDLSIPDMTYVEPIFDLYDPSIPMIPLDTSATVNHAPFVEPIIDETVNHAPFVEPIIDETVSHAPFIDPTEYFEDNSTNMTFVSNYVDTSKSSMEMVEPIMNLEHEKHNFTELVIDDDHEVHSLMVLIKPNEYNFDVSFMPVIGDTFKPDMQMFENIDSSKTNNGKMTSVIDNSDDVKQSMFNTLNNADIVHQLMFANTSTIYDTSMKMTVLTGEEYNVKMKMTSPIMDISIPEMDMVHTIENTSIPEMKMISPNMNVSIPEMDMVHTIENTSIPEMIMVHTIENVSIPEMKMIEPIENTSIPEMKMISPNMDTSIPEMLMVEPIQNTSISKMKMVEPIMNTSLGTMEMVSPINSSYTYNGKMVSPIMNTSIPGMKMVSPIENDKPDNMVFTDVLDTSTHEISTGALLNTIVSGEDYSYKTLMVNITDSPKLIQKIQALTRINVDELKTINTEQLVSLANIIEETYDELREREKNMKMQDNKVKPIKRKPMKMQGIEQPPRNTFIVDKIEGVDLAAIDRAWEAKKNANSDKSTGTTGNAI